MNTRRSPKEIAEAMMSRSLCLVQVGACVEDREGRIIAWGWNSSGQDGFGLHAEAHAILRANRHRLRGAAIYVASRRRRSGNSVTSKPCLGCQILIKGAGLAQVLWRDKNKIWHKEHTSSKTFYQTTREIHSC